MIKVTSHTTCAAQCQSISFCTTWPTPTSRSWISRGVVHQCQRSVFRRNSKTWSKSYAEPMCSQVANGLLALDLLRPDDALRLFQMAPRSHSIYPYIRHAKQTCEVLLALMIRFVVPLTQIWWELILPSFAGFVRAKIRTSNDNFILHKEGTWREDRDCFFPRIYDEKIMLQIQGLTGEVAMRDLADNSVILFESPMSDMINMARKQWHV